MILPETISLEAALELALSSAPCLNSDRVPLHDSPGRILAEDIYADSDLPPFNKSAVDGFAYRMLAGTGHAPSLRVIGTVPAGSVPALQVGPGECARIMTGAMIPPGADAVIMVEDTEDAGEGMIRFLKGKTSSNICYQGEDIRKGTVILKRGICIESPHVAVLASVGATHPRVSCQPMIAVLSTGDELVDPGEKLPNAMIRDSNRPQLIAQLNRMKLPATDLGIARDAKEELSSAILTGLSSHEVVLITGGISMGIFDYVPEALDHLNATVLFRSIAIQPGRPTLFARIGDRFVFGLPGNPVSSFVLFELLVKPFLYKLMGHSYSPSRTKLPMGTDYARKKAARKSVLPVSVRQGEIFPVEYHGSAHIHAYTSAAGMICIDPGVTHLKKGELYDVRWL
jgi:molybdopterin molybdotransferase